MSRKKQAIEEIIDKKLAKLREEERAKKRFPIYNSLVCARPGAPPFSYLTLYILNYFWFSYTCPPRAKLCQAKRISLAF